MTNMAVKQYPVEVQPDHLEKITHARPIQALAELIWNGLDADANRVSISFEHNAIGSLDCITVRDNGTGLARANAPEYFSKLGGSWKKSRSTTPKGRNLHGQEGRGRFKAFAIGTNATWEVVYHCEGKTLSYEINMSSNDIRNVTISDEAEAKPSAEIGVTLIIKNLIKDFRAFDSDTALHELTELFALYLSDYEDVRVTVGGRRIDPAKAIESRKCFNLSDIEVNDKSNSVRLEVVEWKGISQRALFLCNEKRFPLIQVGRRFHVGDYQFSAYLQTTYLNIAQTEGSIDLQTT